MFAGMLVFPLLGLLIGWLAKQALGIRMATRGAMAVGAVGALIGGAFGALLIPVITGVFGATFGAAALIWLVERYRNRVI